MTSQVQLLVGMLGLCALALAVAGYRWTQRRRIQRVDAWIRAYLLTRFGEMPTALRISCSDDQLWPVLVWFELPRSRLRHSLQFICSGSEETFYLLQEKSDLGASE